MLHFNTLKYSVLIAMGLAAFVGFPYYYQQNQLNKDRADQIANYALIARDSAIIYKNKYDQAVTQVEAARLDNASLGKLREDLEDITSQFEGINKRLNNVESLSKVTLSAVTNLKGDLADTVIVKDSVKVDAYKFSLGDKYYSVTGIAIPSLKTIELTPSFNADISTAAFWKRKHRFFGIRFGKKEYTAQITSDNPYVKFSNYKFVLKKWK
jgi:hypothetical protein